MTNNRERTRAKITAVLLGIAVILCILFYVYAFVQKAAAEAQRERAELLENAAITHNNLQQKRIRELSDTIISLHEKIKACNKK